MVLSRDSLLGVAMGFTIIVALTGIVLAAQEQPLESRRAAEIREVPPMVLFRSPETAEWVEWRKGQVRACGIDAGKQVSCSHWQAH